MYESLAALAAANATESAVSATLNNLLPAILGFVGVFVGALLNVAAQRRNFNEEQVAIIRERVAELAVSVQEYTTTTKQSRDTLQAGMKLIQNGRIYLDDHGQKLFAKLGDEYFRLFRHSQSLSVRLMSARDRKIADQSQEIHMELGRYHATFNYLFDYRLRHSVTVLNSESDKLVMKCNEMLTMIGPRRYESFWRIRRSETAKKQIAAHLKQQANANESEAMGR